MAAPQLPGTPQPAPPPVTHTEGSVAFLRGPGGLVEVPAELADRYITEQGFLPASAQQVAERRELKKYEGAAAGAVAAAERLGMGLGDALTALPRGAAALGYAATGSEGLRDFAESTSTDKFFRDVAYLEGGAKKEAEFERAQRLQAEAWPTLTAFSRAGGQGLGAALSLGGAVGGTATGAGLAAREAGAGALGALGRQGAVLGTAGAAEGLAFGATSPFDKLDNTPATREAVLSSGLLGAVLGAGLGGASPFVGAGIGRGVGAVRDGAEKLREVFGRRPFRGAPATAAETVDGLVDDVTRSTVEAGPNPTAMREAAAAAAQRAEAQLDELARAQNLDEAARDAAVRRIRGALGKGESEGYVGARAREVGREVTPDTWDKAELTDVGKWVHRDTLVEGATRATTADLDDVLKISRSATEELRNAPLKRDLVAKNLAESGIDETAAIGATQNRVKAIRQGLEDLALSGDFKESTKTFRSVRKILDTADATLAKVDNAADAYMAADQARRALLKMVPGLKSQSTATMAHVADQGRSLLEFVEGQYRQLADDLFSESVWGRQGLAQADVNTSWVGAIDADRVGMRNFTSTGSFDIYGRPVPVADADKIRSYLDRLGSQSLRDTEFRRILDTQEKLATAMRANYELTPANDAALGRALEAVKRMRGTLDKAESVVGSANTIRKTLDAEKAVALGRVGNIVTGFAQDGLRGAISGALFPGGRAGALYTMRNLRALADAQRGAVAEGMANIAETLMATTAPKSAAAAGKAAKSVRSSGLLTTAGESTAKRIRGAMLGVAPAARELLESSRDLPRAEQFERYEKRRDTLAKLVTDPATMHAALTRAVQPILDVHPELGASLMLDAAKRLKALNDSMPGRRDPSIIPSRVRTVVSDVELGRAEAMLEATLDPMSVFRDFQAGQLDYQKLEFARQQYPELFQLARAAALDILPKLEDDVPDAALGQLDLLLGLDGALDPALRPDFLARQVERGRRLRAEAEANQPRPTERAPKFGELAQTKVERMMAT